MHIIYVFNLHKDLSSQVNSISETEDKKINNQMTILNGTWNQICVYHAKENVLFFFFTLHLHSGKKCSFISGERRQNLQRMKIE